MGMMDDDNTVYYDLRMRLATGKELLRVISALRASKGHPGLDNILKQMEDEFRTSIAYVEIPPRRVGRAPTKH